MNQYSTNNKVFNTIIEPVYLRLSKSNFDVHPNDFRTLPSKINDIMVSLKIKEPLVHVNLFIETYKNLKMYKKPTQTEWHKFLLDLHCALTEIDNIKLNKIIKAICFCEFQLDNLENTSISNYILPWFKRFSKNICSCLCLIYKRSKELISENMQDNLLLYLVQLTTCTKLMFTLLVEESSNKIIIIEARRFLKKRFTYIFDGIKKILNNKSCPQTNPGFLQWMDNSLNLLAELDPNKRSNEFIENLKKSIDEVLCHAMSIAQIGFIEDNRKIKASIQTVLDEVKNLEIEFNRPTINSNYTNLYIDIVNDKLCLLERRVNVAVLNMSLKVFSDPWEPLKKLQLMCEDNEKSILSRCESDLDELIQDFDHHVDCMIQIGLFAIACSTNKSIIAKIRSYLASLELLECELIPALTSLYMEPSKTSHLYANQFIKHWSEEVKQLRNDVCSIIDPVAFGQIMFEDFKKNLEELQKSMSNNNEVISKHMVTPLCKHVSMFILVVDASAKDMNLTKGSKILKHVKNIKDVYQEVKAVSNKITDEGNREISNRLLKRMLILYSMIEKVIEAFSKENKYDSEMQLSNSSNESKLNLIINKTDSSKNISLQNIQQRGIEILKDRSILYKTPNKNNVKLLSCLTPKSYISSKKLQNRMLGVSTNRKIVLINSDSEENSNESMDLQITEILEEITNLAETLK